MVPIDTRQLFTYLVVMTLVSLLEIQDLKKLEASGTGNTGNTGDVGRGKGPAGVHCDFKLMSLQGQK